VIIFPVYIYLIKEVKDRVVDIFQAQPFENSFSSPTLANPFRNYAHSYDFINFTA
jgi:hypothetical protein